MSRFAVFEQARLAAPNDLRGRLALHPTFGVLHVKILSRGLVGPTLLSLSSPAPLATTHARKRHFGSNEVICRKAELRIGH